MLASCPAVIKPESGTYGQRASPQGVRFPRHQEKKLQRAHQVRRLFQQALALKQGLPYHADLSVLQVTQSAMNDARGAAGSPGSKVILLHQQGALAVPGTLPRYGHAVDAAADY